MTVPRSSCICINLRRAAGAITSFYNNKLLPSGLSFHQYTLLNTLEQLGVASVSDLSRQLRLDRSTLVRNLKPLRTAGWIYDLSTNGTRNRKWEVTIAGKDCLAKARPLWVDAQSEVSVRLGGRQVQNMLTFLSSIENIKEVPESFF